MRTRRPGLGVFGGAAPPTFDKYERASVIGQAAGPRAITREQAERAGLHGATNLPRLDHPKAEHRGRLPGWNFHIPLRQDEVVTSRALAGDPRQPGSEELRALGALLRLPEQERLTADRLEELAKLLKIDVAVFLGVAKALAEIPPEARATALERAEKLLKERERLDLEALCARIFMDVALPSATCPVSLLLFDYEPGHVAYKTALDRAAFGQAMHELVESWRTGKPREVRSARPLNLPDAEQAERILKAVKAALPAELGAALLFGEPPATLYVSSADREGMTRLLAELAENIAFDDAVDVVGRARAVVADWHCPPGAIRSPQQCELFAMNCAHAFGRLGWRPGMTQLATNAWEERAVLGARNNPAFDTLLRRMLLFLGDVEHHGEFGGARFDELATFLHAWREASYARLEIGHKLAAALCLTDVPDELEVRAPWGAWSLVLPDGLLPTTPGERRAARLWLMGMDVLFVVLEDGYVAERLGDVAAVGRLGATLSNLIRGACLALSNPEAARKQSHRAQGSKASRGRHGPPELEQARYMLSAPVKIDLREHLHAALTGRKGASPTVQFLVRGHWRQQAHGPGHKLRRAQWIEPFWKGPEEARVLLRQHKVQE